MLDPEFGNCPLILSKLKVFTPHYHKLFTEIASSLDWALLSFQIVTMDEKEELW